MSNNTKKFGLSGVGANVQYGEHGPRLRVNGGVFESRNAADTAFARISAAPAVNPNDVVVLSQLGGGSVSSGVFSRRGAFDYTMGTSTPFGAVIPIGAIVTRAIVNVVEAFDGTAPTMVIGVNGALDAITIAEDVNLKSVGLYTPSCWCEFLSNTQAVATILPSGSTQGIIKVLLEYHGV